MSEQATKVDLWESAERTDPTFTKENKYATGGSTSINTTYMFKRATEIFGPVGIGWGYEIVGDTITDGATKTYGPQESPKTMVDKIHTLHIRFWYVQDGKRGEFDQYGHTDFVTLSSKGIVHTESEPQKKSLSDAIKKSLSMLGFSADIFLGLYDDQQYVESVRRDIRADGAEEKIDREAEKVVEYREWVESQIELINGATNGSAVSLYSKKAIRVLAERMSHNRITKQQHDKGVRAIQQATDEAAKKFEQKKKTDNE